MSALCEFLFPQLSSNTVSKRLLRSAPTDMIYLKLKHRFCPFTGSEKSSSTSVWDTTNKVLGVNTVLGTAGLASASITLPSLGGGVVGGAATAAFGVATAASLVTGVGVIAGMGVAGVQYVRRQSQKRKRREKKTKRGLNKEDNVVENAPAARSEGVEELQREEEESDIDDISSEDEAEDGDDDTTEEGDDGDDEDEGETKEAERSTSSET